MSRDHDFDSRKIALCGRSGRGKSTLHRQIVREHSAKFIFIFDHKGEFARKLPAKKTCYTEADCFASLAQTQCVIFNPSKMFPGRKLDDSGKKIPWGLKEGFAHFCEWVYEVCQHIEGRKLFVADELRRLGILAASYATHPLNAILETGREWEIDVALAAQRPTHMPPDLRGQISNWILFQMAVGWTKPLVEDYEEDFSRVSRLPKGRFISYDAESGEFDDGEATPETKR